jgi:DNA-directed RNA polymerase subunit F
MTEVIATVAPLTKTCGDLFTKGDYTTARKILIILRDYIDQNLAGVQHFANIADVEQPAAQELVLGLVDLRSGVDNVLERFDYLNPENTDDVTIVFEGGIKLITSATSHFNNAVALTPRPH